MLEAVRQVKATNSSRPVCLAVHGLFADRSDELLGAVGATVVTSNTVPHSTNMTDVSQLLAGCVSELVAETPVPPTR